MHLNDNMLIVKLVSCIFLKHQNLKEIIGERFANKEEQCKAYFLKVDDSGWKVRTYISLGTKFSNKIKFCGQSLK